MIDRDPKAIKIAHLRKQLMKKTTEQVRERFETRDIHIIRGVNTLQDLDNIYNLIIEHVKTWYGVHFPEMERSVKNHDAYLSYILTYGLREKFTDPTLKEMAKKSMGSSLSPEDLIEIQQLAKSAQEVKKTRDHIASYLEQEMKKQAPNFSTVCSALLGAKMIALAGSIQRLAEMPSSTIQILGAEKALFSHLKTGTKPPKHGLLFQHSLVQRVKKKRRGKMARAIAGKLAIAIKADYFGKTDISKKLTEQIEQRFLELNK